MGGRIRLLTVILLHYLIDRFRQATPYGKSPGFGSGASALGGSVRIISPDYQPGLSARIIRKTAKPVTLTFP